MPPRATMAATDMRPSFSRDLANGDELSGALSPHPVRALSD